MWNGVVCVRRLGKLLIIYCYIVICKAYMVSSVVFVCGAVGYA